MPEADCMLFIQTVQFGTEEAFWRFLLGPVAHRDQALVVKDEQYINKKLDSIDLEVLVEEANKCHTEKHLHQSKLCWRTEENRTESKKRWQELRR